MDSLSSKSEIHNVNNVNKCFEKTFIYEVLSGKPRSIKTLEALNSALAIPDNAKDINMRNDEGESYLHYLIENTNHSDEVSWRMVYSLSNAGIDVNIRNIKGNTALHCAYMKGYADVGFKFIEALLKCGVDPRIKNNNGYQASKYMEEMEQLKIMQKVYEPGILAAFESNDVTRIDQLLKAMVKVNVRLNDKLLIDAETNNDQIKQLLLKYKDVNEFVHAIYATDKRLINEISKRPSFSIDPNLVDPNCSNVWFKSTNRNLPKSLLEIGLDTKRCDLVELLLDMKCDVNLPHSKNADPLFFYCFEPEFRSLKEAFLEKADLTLRNQKGQNILFFLVFLYLKLNTTDNTNGDTNLINDFCEILNKKPILLSDRDQDGCTLVETIRRLAPKQYKLGTVFIDEINKFVFQKLDKNDTDYFIELIYNGYGLILIETQIIIQNSTNDQSNSNETKQTFLNYVNEHKMTNLESFIDRLFSSTFTKQINEFGRSIKNGDIEKLKHLIQVNQDLALLKDWAGRTCAHYSVLFSQLPILKYLLNSHPKLLNCQDNLNRTILHYAYANGDKNIIQYLIENHIDSKIKDAKFLTAEEYLDEEIRNDVQYRVKNFKETEMKKRYGLSSYIKCYVYPKVKKAILSNSVEELTKLKDEFEIYEIRLNDIPSQATQNDWIDGEPYVPPLVLAMESHSFSAFRYILDETVEQINDSFNKSGSNLRKKSGAQSNDNLNSLRDMAEQMEIYEIIDILDNYDEDLEINAALFGKSSAYNQQSVNDISTKLIEESTTRRLSLPKNVKSPLSKSLKIDQNIIDKQQQQQPTPSGKQSSISQMCRIL